jgi:ABC-type dipeptide/oligopeptide/nickel transport system permease subunit
MADSLSAVVLGSAVAIVTASGLLTLSALAGYYGDWVELRMSWLCERMLAMPFFPQVHTKTAAFHHKLRYANLRDNVC